jgi:molybdopterin-guanine dinucleotide biosynthesis protein A
MGGVPKALLEVGGTPIIERVVAALTPVVDDVLVVTNSPHTYRFLHLPLIPDVYPDRGSLGGLYSGLKAATGEVAFTVACDMPFLEPEVIRLVLRQAGEADVVVPRFGDQLETMHAAYARACLAHIEPRLLSGRLRIADFLGAVRVLEIPEQEIARVCPPDIVFMNVNTPADLQRARQIAKGRG